MQRADHVPFCLTFPVLLATAIFFAWGCDDGDSGSSVDLLTQRKFEFTGEPQEFIVPAGVTLITVEANGASGGDGWNVDDGGSVKGFGGFGGSIEATLEVTAGEMLYIYVGGAGEDATTSPGAGGWNGGGDGEGSDFGYSGGGGGGASDVRRGGEALTDRILVAGGGGSGSGWCTSGDGNGGDGGDDENDTDGEDGDMCGAIPVGTGGTDSAGGSIGGAFGVGGTPPYGTAGAAGGGGWYGGGASDGSGGGGGSNYVTPVGSSSVNNVRGARDGNGSVFIRWVWCSSVLENCE